MTPIEAHKYSHKLKIDILEGPNYRAGKKEKSFTGWGYHDSLNMVFRGPGHYREYLRENGMEEWGDSDFPQYKESSPPLWDDVLIKKAVDLGIYMPGRLVEALKSGEIDYPEDAEF
jgi:hypothetical protein